MHSAPFYLMFLVCLEVPSLPSIQRHFTDTAWHPHPIIPYRRWDHHLPCDLPKAKENSNHPWWFVTGAEEFRKKRHLPKIIVWPSKIGDGDLLRVLSSKHRLNSFGGLSLVCDWRYACLPETNGVLSSPLKFFPARTWRSRWIFDRNSFWDDRPTDLFSGVANLESDSFKSGGGNVFPQPPRSSRFGIPAIHREVGKTLEK